MSKGKIYTLLVAIGIGALTFIMWPAKQEEVSLPIKEEPLALIPPPSISPITPPFVPPPKEETFHSLSDESQLPKDVDRMTLLFQPFPPTHPLVETISYASRVAWLTGRSAFLGDYASHYKTSKHFISRSLHGIGNYLSDKVSMGDRFNVLRTDKEIEFHLVLDLSRLKMWVYALDKGTQNRYLLKTYPVCAGRLDKTKLSGSLTPIGTFALGEEIAVYKPGTKGTIKNKTAEYITIFGKRWIPLKQEVANCSESCKGLGIHGMPWEMELTSGKYIEKRDGMGQFESEGCIRLLSEDIEELFSVVVSRPGFIHIVKDFTLANLPGKEVQA